MVGHLVVQRLEQAQLSLECLANNAKFTSWECDRAKMDLTAEKKALFMHCLPADITDISCKAGEVSALMFLTRLQNPGDKLQQIVDRAQRLSL